MLEALKLRTRENNVLLKFFKVLHHNFTVLVYTGYTEVGYSPPYNIMNSKVPIVVGNSIVYLFAKFFVNNVLNFDMYHIKESNGAMPPCSVIV